jgi:hypothetical protein
MLFDTSEDAACACARRAALRPVSSERELGVDSLSRQEVVRRIPRWWRAYLVSPLGTVAGVALYVTFSGGCALVATAESVVTSD